MLFDPQLRILEPDALKGPQDNDGGEGLLHHAPPLAAVVQQQSRAEAPEELRLRGGEGAGRGR